MDMGLKSEELSELRLLLDIPTEIPPEECFQLEIVINKERINGEFIDTSIWEGQT
ncbi:hypothetical protein AGABI1DRAFT_111068 [Agaricus bisporus var. burnettii JB137-S8]|uniref:Uncharacterized protein n=1 Tax=Agaricus bisporus var. burnettii (strain JB137-S8 / ATCC MYA-4627 / FGSC 10392) TaxID=597362 RepID=K5X3M9_AGABU|nr:hypothetical protein AGABI2DRAFT_190281 [Agaricus bisporus var. bisporus H97]XP_007326461.1 uncharacterized protein AGABI1DRAFT_111068 [Agaricus bisporus var. burnettii JB137-S8]EKM82446.1 hypothetical protein AGABI1DRAFT_111068 [Agaricus bisporus var. burnettii JB137-S8]EKV49839.1 hypothetical protein AGABI2DRAFT_190281 [Agaricus bisporus var. bisporus H97]